MPSSYYYIVVDTMGQRFFLSTDGGLTEFFDRVKRFPNRCAAQAYLRNHPRESGRADIIGMR